MPGSNDGMSRPRKVLPDFWVLPEPVGPRGGADVGWAGGAEAGALGASGTWANEVAALNTAITVTMEEWNGARTRARILHLSHILRAQNPFLAHLDLEEIALAPLDVDVVELRGDEHGEHFAALDIDRK